MRWDELFADLAAQAESWDLAEQQLEVADRTRAEVGQITLVSRLQAGRGRSVRLRVAGVGEMGGVLSAVGAEWFLLSAPREVLVVFDAVQLIHNLPPEAVVPEAVPRLARATSLTAALRAVARDRAAVTIVLRDGEAVTGTPDRVGRDWVDLAVHEPGVAPRASSVRGRATLSFGAISVVARTGPRW